MIEYKQGLTKFVPVRIFNSVGDPVSGIAFGSVTATTKKADGSTEAVSVTGADWQEVVAGAFAGAGVYALKLSASNLNQTGTLTYAVATTGNKTFVGAIKVVANEEVDTYTRIGAPTLASVSADIANLDSDIANLDTDVANVYRRIGAPTLASVSADIANLDADVANVDSDVATLTSNVANLDADVAAVASNVTSTLTIVQVLQKYEEGRWKIHTTGGDANRLVLYDTDNTTPLLKFDLKDSTGGATFAEPFERLPV